MKIEQYKGIYDKIVYNLLNRMLVSEFHSDETLMYRSSQRGMNRP